jgi:hypothetical protein
MALLPGLPVIPGFVPEQFGLLLQDAVTSLDGADPLWGIYRGAVPVVVCDTVTTFEFRKDYDISDFPIEQGAFASYNKVELPTTVRIQFTTGGSSEDKAAMIASIDAIIATTELFSVATPEKSWTDMNVVHQDFNRAAAKSLGLLKIDVWLEQVRPVGAALTTTTTGGTSAFTPTDQNAPGSTVAPSGANPVAGGTVQPLTPQILQEHAAEFQVPDFIPDPDPNATGFEGVRPLTIHPRAN